MRLFDDPFRLGGPSGGTAWDLQRLPTLGGARPRRAAIRECRAYGDHASEEPGGVMAANWAGNGDELVRVPT
jgi:hypothetical protein